MQKSKKMERIEICFAIRIADNVVLFEAKNKMPGGNNYFLGWRSHYTGPHDPGCEDEGANYKGDIICEIPENIADYICAVIQGDIDTLVTVGRIIGRCEQASKEKTTSNFLSDII